MMSGLLLAALVGCDEPAKAPGTAAPRFELKDASGQIHRLEDLRGNVVLLHFWASWCPPCLEEIPRWLSAAAQFRNLPVKMVAISVDEEWAAALKILPVADVPANMLSLLDPESSVSRSYGTTRFPETYLLDPDFKIVEKWQGVTDWNSSRVRFAVSKALVKSNVSGSAGSPRTPAPAPSAR